jgi:hypothetical protein
MLKRILQTLCTVIIFILIISKTSDVFRDKSKDSFLLYNFEKEQANDIDVIFAGSSHMNNAVYPMRLWDRYGITSFNNAQTAQILPLTYYSCDDIVSLVHPKVIVLDLYMLYYNQKICSTSWMHETIDPLKHNVLHIQSILDLIPADQQKEFLFPLTLYHTRWKELKKTDFIQSNDICRGSQPLFDVASDITGMTFEKDIDENKQEPEEIPVAYLDKIVRLCKDNDIQLVLVAIPYFTSSEVLKPTHDMSNDQAYFNWAMDYAQQNGIECINFFHIMDKIGFDFKQDMHDYSHLNYWGGKIITDYIGAYLSEHFDLQDHREDPAYAVWNSDSAAFQEYVDQNT